MSSTELPRTLLQVRAAQAGDAAALNDLLARYAPWVRQTVTLRLGKPLRECPDVDDITQESLLDAFRSLDSFEQRSEGSFRNWLAQIVLNNVRDAHRRGTSGRERAGRLALPLDHGQGSQGPSIPDPIASPSQHAQAAELGDRIEACMLQLSPTHREILILRDRCALEYDEIAKSLGFKNADTARALHHRALASLRELLGGDPASPEPPS